MVLGFDCDFLFNFEIIFPCVSCGTLLPVFVCLADYLSRPNVFHLYLIILPSFVYLGHLPLTLAFLHYHKLVHLLFCYSINIVKLNPLCQMSCIWVPNPLLFCVCAW